MLAAKVERPREPAEQPDAQLRAAVAERRRRLLEQLDGALVGDPRAPAGLLVADRRPREQLRVAELARDLARRDRRRSSASPRVARAMAGGAELEVDLRALARVVDPQVERGAQPRRRLVEGQPGGRRPGGEQVVLDRPLGPAERGGGGEVVGEVGERPARAAVGPLERLATRRWSSARRIALSRS